MSGFHCRFTGKASYRTKEFAERVLHNIWRHPRRGPGVMPSRAYLCDCRSWHLTHLTLEQHEERLRGKEAKP